MKQITFLLFVLINIIGNAQDYRFGKVDEVDFQRVTPEEEEEPAAEVLYRKEHVSFRYVSGEGFVQERMIHERIKINTEEGLDYATKSIRLYNQSVNRRERLKNLKGYTYHNEDGKIKDVKLRNSGEFEEEIDEYWKRSSFTLPDVRIGSVIEYEYNIESPFLTIDDIDLQYNIPIRKIDVRVEMIEYFTYNVLFNPRAAYVPNLDSSVASRNIRTTSKNRSGSDEAVVNTTFSSSQYVLSNKVLSIDDTDIPALIEEPMVGSLSNYRAKIIFELAVIRYPSEPAKYLSVNWESVSKSIYENERFGDQIDIKPFYKDELDAKLEGVLPQMEKAGAILNFLRGKVKWNGYYGITAQKGVKDAYKEGSGNVADVNLLLTSMLQSQNIEAYPMLLSTEENGIPLFPTRDGFNYVAVVAKIGGEEIFLDGTDPNLPMGELPLRAINWEGRAISKDGGSFVVDLNIKEVSKELIMTTVDLNEDLTLKGNVAKRLTKYAAYDYRSKYGNKANEVVVDYLKSDDVGVDLQNVKIKQVKDLEKPVGLTYDIQLNNSAESIGDKVYLSPLLNESNKENPFKLKERLLPVELRYPLSTKTVVNIDLPEGYVVESLPESVQINYNENKGSYRYVVSNVGNRITVVADFEMNQSVVQPNDYPIWKDFFTAIVAKDAEKIVLKKI